MRQPIFIALLFILLSVVPALVCARSIPAMEFALQDDAVFAGSVNVDMDTRSVQIVTPNQDLAFQRALELGVQRIRTMLYIQDPCTPQVIRDAHRQQYTQFVSKARGFGLEVHLTLSGIAAPWGRPIGWSVEKDPNGNWIPFYCNNATGVLPNMTLWSEWVSDSISFYSQIGVTRFTLWNEPNLPAFLCPVIPTIPPNGTIDDAKCLNATIEQQATLYMTVWHTGAKAVDELRQMGVINDSVQVLVGDLAPLPNVKEFMERMEDVIADGFGEHPYQYCTPPETQLPIFDPNITTCQHLAGKGAGIAWAEDLQHRLSYLAGKGQLVLRGSNNSAPLPLFLTEFGYPRTGPNALPEDVRCDWLPRAMSVAAKAGVKSMNVYQLFISPPWVAWDTGITDEAGNPLCSYTALQQWATDNGYPTQPLPEGTKWNPAALEPLPRPHGTVRGRAVHLGWTINSIDQA
jgi:hypothetical protein